MHKKSCNSQVLCSLLLNLLKKLVWETCILIYIHVYMYISAYMGIYVYIFFLATKIKFVKDVYHYSQCSFFLKSSPSIVSYILESQNSDHLLICINYSSD